MRDSYFDQVEATGHGRRREDLDLIASLGLRTLRYPVLWERVAPNGVRRADWHWTDERLGYLAELGIDPVVGLVHHGSGPRYTDLLDESFPEKLAEYAQAVARRYPWVSRYTPVNEPLTTARFSALYGHWYPHRRDDRSFVRALLNQCRGTLLAMQAIREISPSAVLIQTEDFASVRSRPALAQQASFENQRRWLSLDLLAGRVAIDHPLWAWLLNAGASREELAWFTEQESGPDVIGLNYYITGERFLDERWQQYPAQYHGGNGREPYADIEAVRVSGQMLLGHQRVLMETWERYGTPVAVTEVHLGCTREEQLRWLDECWRGAQAARAAGVDVVAITIWALFGLMDWHCLVTRAEGCYEPGVFDTRAEPPRPTALARAVRSLVQRGHLDHPVLGQDGWWRRPERILRAVPEGAASP